MSYVPHAVLQFGGQAFTTEEWSCRLNLTSTGWINATEAQRQAFCSAGIADVSTDVRNMFINAGALFPSSHFLDFVKFNSVGADGKYASVSTTNVTDFGTGRLEGVGPAGPPQCTIAVSLTTAALRGRGHRGRFYFPSGKVDIDAAAGTIPTVLQTNLANAVHDALVAINDWPGLDPIVSPEVAVVSNVGTPGPWSHVTGVEVGSILDTQRRRRNGLRETYVKSGPIA